MFSIVSQRNRLAVVGCQKMVIHYRKMEGDAVSLLEDEMVKLIVKSYLVKPSENPTLVCTV